MKLNQLVAKPQLIEITLDDELTVSEFGEAITFHTWDRQPMDIFMRLAQATETTATIEIIGIVKDLILDETGKPMLTGDQMLPTKVLMRVIGKITESLGK